MTKSKSNINFIIPFGILAGLFFIFRKKTTGSIAGIGAVSAKYFKVSNETTIDDLKRQYYKLAKLHHPDTGGTNEGFREMNDEYERLQKLILSNGNFTTDEYQNETDISEIYRDIINTIITIPGINIEIVGTWIWISGNTYPVKDQIKEAGFKFHGKKTMWFWHPGEYHKFNNKEMDMDEIRSRYGSENVKGKAENKSLNGIGSLSDKFRRLQELLMNREKFNKG